MDLPQFNASLDAEAKQIPVLTWKSILLTVAWLGVSSIAMIGSMGVVFRS